MLTPIFFFGVIAENDYRVPLHQAITITQQRGPSSHLVHLPHWSQGKNTALNITVVNPLKEANAKMSKYEDKCVAEDIACCGHL